MFQLPSSLPLTFTKSEGAYKEIFSPNDGTLLTKVQNATEKDIELVISETKTIQKKIAKLRPYEKAEILKKVAASIKEKQEFLAKVIASEGGKPLKDARAETSRAAATLELCAEETLRLHGEVVPMERTPAGKDHLSFVTRDPIGPVLAISAFNHPLNLIAHQVGCAIASGCSVVLKPASSTPLSAHFLVEAFNEAGLPSQGIRLVTTESSLAQKLAESPVFDFVSFIGSAKVGWELRRKIAPGTRLALEHGGQAPVIVRSDADVDAAVSALVKGAFYHAGQVCISSQNIFVHESIFEKFLSQFKGATEKLKTGSAMDEDTDVGPLIRPDEVERLVKWINEAQEKGAKVVLGNKVFGNKNQYLSPTILTHVPRECTIMKDEAFGPIVNINPYQDEEELLQYFNDKDYIFESALFTRDISQALRIASEISTMTFVINNHSAFRVDQMPFGGHKMSGLGMGGVKYAMEEMTRMKQIIIKM
jgi:acyl-CoA reductase-like NAD-dependent aldehyde dehydrogenase